MIKSILFITGISGSGRAEVIKALEDFDFFCVDNFPIALLQDLIRVVDLSSLNEQNLSISLDIRSHDFITNFLPTLDKLDLDETPHRLLFLDCNDEVLVRRYSETRRRHPLQKSSSLFEAITEERVLLSKIRARANFILDTSSLKTQELRERISDLILKQDVSLDLVINVLSFGFKNGVPLDADFMFDVRFLANPYYDTDLRPQNGLDLAVSEFVFSQLEATQAVSSISDLMKNWIPLHIKAGKTSLTIAIGCTGGQHRSVAITEKVSETLMQKFKRVTPIHRDIR